MPKTFHCLKLPCVFDNKYQSGTYDDIGCIPFNELPEKLLNISEDAMVYLTLQQPENPSDPANCKMLYKSVLAKKSYFLKLTQFEECQTTKSVAEDVEFVINFQRNNNSYETAGNSFSPKMAEMTEYLVSNLFLSRTFQSSYQIIDCYFSANPAIQKHQKIEHSENLSDCSIENQITSLKFEPSDLNLIVDPDDANPLRGVIVNNDDLRNLLLQEKYNIQSVVSTVMSKVCECFLGKTIKANNPKYSYSPVNPSVEIIKEPDDTILITINSPVNLQLLSDGICVNNYNLIIEIPYNKNFSCKKTPLIKIIENPVVATEIVEIEKTQLLPDLCRFIDNIISKIDNGKYKTKLEKLKITIFSDSNAGILYKRSYFNIIASIIKKCNSVDFTEQMNVFIISLSEHNKKLWSEIYDNAIIKPKSLKYESDIFPGF
ncbi:MAG: hypothetical protein KIT27_02035 [Legionellales bacterium]|nr:hypothetical protein [Legionellales bacterium]